MFDPSTTHSSVSEVIEVITITRAFVDASCFVGSRQESDDVSECVELYEESSEEDDGKEKSFAVIDTREVRRCSLEDEWLV